MLGLQCMNNQWTKSTFKNRPRCYVKSPTAQDVFQPIPGFISCAEVTGRWGLLCQHWHQVTAHRPCNNSRRTILPFTVSDQLVHVLCRLTASVERCFRSPVMLHHPRVPVMAGTSLSSGLSQLPGHWLLLVALENQLIHLCTQTSLHQTYFIHHA